MRDETKALMETTSALVRDVTLEAAKKLIKDDAPEYTARALAWSLCQNAALLHAAELRKTPEGRALLEGQILNSLRDGRS